MILPMGQQTGLPVVVAVLTCYRNMDLEMASVPLASNYLDTYYACRLSMSVCSSRHGSRPVLTTSARIGVAYVY